MKTGMKHEGKGCTVYVLQIKQTIKNVKKGSLPLTNPYYDSLIFLLLFLEDKKMGLGHLRTTLN